MLSRSHTYVMELNGAWQGEFATEPYEAPWGHEAILFVRALESSGFEKAEARVQISPDGVFWCNEGTTIPLAPAPEMTFCRVSHFGGFLRLTGELPPGASMKVLAYAAVKE
jgi:hypothetical protein